jgi:hypothetical protein
MMHEGMDGKHLFQINLKTNDPANISKALYVASNWVPPGAPASK